jgi:hypothetical protein
VWAGPLSDWFERKSKPAGPEQVMELVNTLQNDSNASKRAHAAEELAHFDGQAYPEILPALINSLQHDSSASVRRDAAQALGRLRPTSHDAAQALDQTIANDSSTLVRFQARTARLGYHAPIAPASEKAPPANPTPIQRLPDPDTSPLPPPSSRPLPKPPNDKSVGDNPAEPPKFLPDDLPRLLPPLPLKPKEKQEEKKDEGGAILAAPKRQSDGK